MKNEITWEQANGIAGKKPFQVAMLYAMRTLPAGPLSEGKRRLLCALHYSHQLQCGMDVLDDLLAAW